VLAIAVNGEPLDAGRTYRIAVNDFMARGGDGYSAFAAIEPVVPLEDTPLLSDEVMIYLRDLPSVQSGVEGRLASK
jgi:2',3'-cyclic-nucleotide 2'-phosphodiesterase (5'-nucleotidase family)